MNVYLIPAQEIRREIIVVNSRFIATLAPVFSVNEAKIFIKRIKDEFVDASHNVPAYLIGSGTTEIAHCSDDGEPSGTAGRPILSVLRGSNLGDVAVVVTRCFGGTKLGKGGLVRAYSQAVRQVVEAVPRASKIPTHTVMIGLPYNYLERVRLLIELHNGSILDEDFSAEVTLTARFPVTHTPDFQEDLRDLSAGKLEAEIMETQISVVPLSE